MHSACGIKHLLRRGGAGRFYSTENIDKTWGAAAVAQYCSSRQACCICTCIKHLLERAFVKALNWSDMQLIKELQRPVCHIVQVHTTHRGKEDEGQNISNKRIVFTGISCSTGYPTDKTNHITQVA